MSEIIDALNRALTALNSLSVSLELAASCLASLRKTVTWAELQFDHNDDLKCATFRHSRLPISESSMVQIRSDCEWLPKYVEALWEAYPEADGAIVGLPVKVAGRLDALTGTPWISSVRRNCLDEILKWPGERYHQTSYAAKKVFGRIEDLLQYANEFDPFPTWEGYQDLLASYRSDLFAVRDVELSESVPRSAADSAGASAVIDDLVTLDQVAPLAGLSKRTLERYLHREELPEPDVRGGGGRAHKWYWRNLRPRLSEICDRILPERFPGSRIV